MSEQKKRPAEPGGEKRRRFSIGKIFFHNTFVLAFSFVWPPRLVAGLVLALLVLCPCISALAYRISSREPVIQRLHKTS